MRVKVSDGIQPETKVDPLIHALSHKEAQVKSEWRRCPSSSLLLPELLVCIVPQLLAYSALLVWQAAQWQAACT